jgi:transposase InsO family protein
MIAPRRSPTVRRQSSVLRHNVTLDRTRTPGSRRARQARGDPNVSKPLTPPSKVRPSSTYYRWKAEYGGLQLSEAKRMRQLEDEIGSSRRSSLIPHSTARRSRDCSAESGGSSRAVDDRSYRDTRSPNQALWPPGASWKRMRAHAPRFERAEWDASTPCRDPACDWSQPRPAGIDSRWTVAGLPRSSGRRHLRSGLPRRPPRRSTSAVRSRSRQPVLSMRYTERLADAGIEPSVGSRGDSYDNALAESVIGLFKAEVIRRKGPWRTLEAVEFATLTWIDWFNHRRLLEPLGYVPPAEYEARYYEQAAVA